MIYIIADDLTGATDTGVQFSKQGYNTQVVIVSEAEPHSLTESLQRSGDTDVFVIDTETRETDAATARKRIKRILEGLSVHDEDIVYKKVDSTLRGNIGAELDECMNALEKDTCIFAPSFPPNERITVEGYLIVHDQLLGLSEYYDGELEPEEASFIPALLKPHTNLPIARIDLKEVIKGSGTILEKLRALHHAEQKVIVVDAINGEQLRNILKSSFNFEGSVLYSGSAGLADSLATIYNGKKQARLAIRQNQHAVLIVSGSRRTLVQQQIAYLKQRVPVTEVSLNVEYMLCARAGYLDQCTTEVTQSLQRGCHTVIQLEARYQDQALTQTLLAQYALNFRVLELAIRGFLGELVAMVMAHTPVYNLIMTGGDTAIGICAALHIHSLQIVDELFPGIPLSVGKCRSKLDLNIVTKVGGFGEETTFYLLIEKLMLK